MDYSKISMSDWEAIQTPAKPQRLEYVPLQGLRDLDLAAARALQRLKKASASIESDIAKLDPGLRADVKLQRVESIKQKYVDQIVAAMGIIGNGRKVAEAQEVFWQRGAWLLRARFSDDAAADAQIRSMWITRLGKLSPVMLIETSRFAAAKNDLPLASALLDEFHARTDVPQGEKRKAMQWLSEIPCAADEAVEIFERLKLYAVECLELTSTDRTGLGVRKIAIALQAKRTRQIFDTSVDDSGDNPEAFFLP